MTDLSTGLCVGDLTFTDRPQREQYATCSRCPVREACEWRALTSDVPNTCKFHANYQPNCRSCRAWLHTYDHRPEWGNGDRKRCLVCHRRSWAKRRKARR